MVFKCCVPCCSYTNSEKKMHVFPKDEQEFLNWCESIHRQDLLALNMESVRKNYRVCDHHFSEESKFHTNRNRTNIKSGSIPTIHLPGQYAEKGAVPISTADNVLESCETPQSVDQPVILEKRDEPVPGPSTQKPPTKSSKRQILRKDINSLIKSLVELQERRQENQPLATVRVVTGNRSYYAKVNISTEAILILPYDINIPDSHFRSVHVKGFHEVGDKAIRLDLYNEGPYVLHVHTKEQMGRVVKGIKILTSSQTTSDSDTSDTS